MTIIGDPNNNRKAIEMIICKILEDPQSSSCLNISYGEIQGLVANPHPTGSPYAPVSNHLKILIDSEVGLELMVNNACVC